MLSSTLAIVAGSSMPVKLAAASPAIAGSGWQITLSQSCTAIRCGPCQHRFPGCQSPCPITGSRAWPRS